MPVQVRTHQRSESGGLRTIVPDVVQGWQAPALFGGIVASWAVLTFTGRQLVRWIYEGGAPAFLDTFMSHRAEHPVDYFYPVTDAPILGLHLILSVAALVWLTRARRSAWLWFGLFVAGDIGLVALDISSRSVFMKIWHERSVPEWFGYLKQILFAGSMYRVFKASGAKVYASLSLLGFMLFLDDSAGYHEFMGRILAPVAAATGLPLILEVDAHYFGEVLSLVPYVLLVLAGFFFCLRSGSDARRNAGRAAGLIGLLFVFGVVVDLIPHLGRLAGLPQLPFAPAWIEDFGEMILFSALAAFGAAVWWQQRASRRSAIATPTHP
jgi:hypothetical protein